ncbi:MAG: TRAP transporter permease [Spirochaetales bacterium]|nr:TRAP transporter permease [Spirochaetales bacterium]
MKPKKVSQEQEEKNLDLEEILQQEAGVTRVHRTFDRYLISFVALAWAFFQLSLPRFVVLDSVFVRSIHLAFALVLVFLGVPFTRKRKRDIPGLHSLKHTPAIDFILAVVGALSVTYIIWNWDSIAQRAGIPSTQDIIIGTTMIILLLEAARRGIGLPMVVIAILFSLYGFFGRYMPGVMAWRGISLGRYIGQAVLSSEGVFGIPLDVSARTVYLFVLFGAFLDRFGAGQFFNNVSISLLGRFKGGPAKAAVVSSGFTGLVSGSSIANVVTTGTFTIPLMMKVGYPGKTAAATEVAASTNGQLMPPIMGAAAFIIAEYLGIGYLGVVRAAIIPAVVSYIALFYITHLEASKLGLMGLEKEDIPNFLKTISQGFHHLVPLVILIYELAVMRRTPNLAVFKAILYLLGIYIAREIWFSSRGGEKPLQILKKVTIEIGEALVQGSKNMIPVALATATAGIIVGIVNLGIGSRIVQMVEVLSMGNVFLLLFLTAFFSLIIGMGLPTTATYIVMASLTVPIITRLGGDMGLVIPAIAAHLFCFYFGILADDTPPVGLAAYAAAAIAKSDPIATGIKGFIYDLRTAIIPFMFVFNPAILLIGVEGWASGLAVFVTVTLGTLAFTNAVQGWALVKNKWYEVPIFLVAGLFFYLPNIVSEYLGWQASSYWLIYLVALLLYGGAFGLQKLRIRSLSGASVH